MDSQHRRISVYREPSAEEIAGMNDIKKIGIQLGDLVEALESAPGTDKRWVAIGKTDLQQGIMSLVRSIAKPTVF